MKKTLMMCMGLVLSGMLMFAQPVESKAAGFEYDDASMYLNPPAGAYNPAVDLYAYMVISSDKEALDAGTMTTVRAAVMGNVPDGSLQILWQSSDPAILAVQGAGDTALLGGVREGTASVVATLVVAGKVTDVDTIQIHVRKAGSGYVDTEGITLGANAIQMTPGSIQKLSASPVPANATSKTIHFSSSDPNVASIDSTGKIRAKSAGNCAITAWTEEGKYVAYCNVGVNAPVQVAIQPVPKAAAPGAAVPSAQNTRDPQMIAQTVASVMAAPAGGTVKITAGGPMAYDTNVAAVLAMRPDVSLVSIFSCQGHVYGMTIPAGYNLASRLDVTGYVEWIQLCAKPQGIQLVMMQ